MVATPVVLQAAVNRDSEAAATKQPVEPGSSEAGGSAPTGGHCPSDMVEVRGDYCPTLAQFCVRFVDEKPERDRCEEFRPGNRCYGKIVAMRFCIDRYEYPNQAGASPKVAVNFDEAAGLCKAEGKRLCKATEWTLACEGEEGRPYPYGNKRDANACNIDKPYIVPNNDAFASAKTRDAEFARVDQREPSGSRASCVSPYGVYDLTGNVDEWVVNEDGTRTEKPYNSGLKGGYWGPVRNRCRPMTTDHNAWHYGYQIGFRCCANPSEG